MSAPLRRCDVAVIGGGSAGLAAALAAARRGARTVLIEDQGFAGGMGTASLVHSFCGLYLLRKEPGAVLANPGFCGEIEGLMIAATGMGPQRHGRVDVLPQHPVEFARIADSVLAAEESLECLFHARLIGLSREAEGWSLRVASRGGEFLLDAGVLVDASGDAVVAGLLGDGFSIAPAARLQRPAYVFGVQCGAELDESGRLRTAGCLIEGVRGGMVGVEALGLSFRVSGRPGEVFGSLDLSAGAEAFDPLDPGCLTNLEMTGRKVAAEAVAWLAEREDAWRGAYVRHWPARAGIRESRRWVGEHVLTESEVLEGRRFDDEIALATWPMEMRETAKGPRLRFPNDDLPCGIPLRCLKPRGIDRLFVAGRCISADHGAQASIRVMGTCFATGEAAGKAAAERASAC
jgi:FAD dependent oxidoreductase